MGIFFKYGKDKAAKGEGRAPYFIICAQDTVELLTPLPLRLLGYGKPFIICAQDTVELLTPLPLRLLGYGKPLPLSFRMLSLILPCIL